MITRDSDFGYEDDLTLTTPLPPTEWRHPEFLPVLLDRADDWRTELP